MREEHVQLEFCNLTRLEKHSLELFTKNKFKTHGIWTEQRSVVY